MRRKLAHVLAQSSYGTNVCLYSHSHLNNVSQAIVHLDTWFESLPPTIRIMPQTVSAPDLAVIALNAYFHFVVMLLYRPFYYSGPDAQEQPERLAGIKRCNASA